MLVTGAGGLLGSKIVDLAEELYNVTPTHSTHKIFPNSVQMNVRDAAQVFQVVSSCKPDVVVHAASETNVDRCEVDKDLAWSVNAEGTRNVAEACSRIGAKLVYISTDYVFDGEKGLYVEEDQPNPINNYGLTKLKGEEFVKKYCKNHLILRSSVNYGKHPVKLNFASWVIEALNKREQINIVDDHWNSPTLADNLAEVVLKTVEEDTRGVYHSSGRERISRYEFATKIARIFDLDENLVKPVKMTELTAWVARRPRDSSLCVDRIQEKFNFKLLNIDEGLAMMKGA